jgi:ribosomal protein L34E
MLCQICKKDFFSNKSRYDYGARLCDECYLAWEFCEQIRPPKYDDYKESTQKYVNGGYGGYKMPRITMCELRQRAKKTGMKGYSKMKFAELAQALEVYK